VTTPSDNAGVMVRPPLLYAAALLASLVLRWLWPMPILAHAISLGVGIVLVLLALAVVIPGRRALLAAGTSVDPSLPSKAIVESGPFRFSRNPLYLGLTLLYCGLTLVSNTWWGLILLMPVLAIMHLGVVLREERYLDQKFGDTYKRYRERVGRYL